MGVYDPPAFSERTALPKPEKGDNQLARRARSSEDKRLEKHAKQASKMRDKHLCRFPHCEFRKDNLTMHSAHIHHKGMGGDPKQIRTTVDQLITFCAKHHGAFDVGKFEVRTLTGAGTSGACGFRPRISGDRWGAWVDEIAIGELA